MIKIKEVIIVEGRYDVNTVKQIFDTVVLETGGFRIFSDKERLKMFRKMAEERGLLILTDSDGAGMVIRNYLKSAIPANLIKHAYIPEIMGKESRKRTASKEGKLGVEGMKPDVLCRVLQRAGATVLEGESGDHAARGKTISKADLYALGLSGCPKSEQLRARVLKEFELPSYLSANALLEYLNTVSSLEEITEVVEKLQKN
ncbi:MAG: DUF4093 domain-containing protein [Butyricicoccus pullicaecorum]|nr:DUF4093 domain-containing protein [Butyricicoccus pullicaecorum]MDO4669391.1 DUF4093 domain-containing protein [Butyricicoccus pullicaecorum]